MKPEILQLNGSRQTLNFDGSRVVQRRWLAIKRGFVQRVPNRGRSRQFSNRHSEFGDVQ